MMNSQKKALELSAVPGNGFYAVKEYGRLHRWYDYESTSGLQWTRTLPDDSLPHLPGKSLRSPALHDGLGRYAPTGRAWGWSSESELGIFFLLVFSLPPVTEG